jgi:hypothetical protein
MKTLKHFTVMLCAALSGYAMPASSAESRGEAWPFAAWAQVEPLACPSGTIPTATEIANACQIATSGPTQSVVSGQFGNPVLIQQDIAYSFKLGLSNWNGSLYTYVGTLYFSPSTSGYYTLYLRGSPTSFTYRTPGISSQQPATVACSSTISSSSCSAYSSYATLYMTAGYFYYFKYGPFSTTSSTAPTYRVLIRQKAASLAAPASLND